MSPPARVHPFRAVRYARRDLSALIAPPYDVLDAAAKAALLARDRRNIVAIDLPHTPAKELGPPEAYAEAGDIYRRWLADGTLVRDSSAAIYIYRQSFKDKSRADSNGNAPIVERRGVCCCVDAVPFGPRDGGGILPHEETFSGPKEDRLALMTATEAQLSPIFALHADERGEARAFIERIIASRAPDISAQLGGGGEGDDAVTHDVWACVDDATISAYRNALTGEDIFIADGHHRYNTHLNYIKRLEFSNKKPLPPNHPARRCMMVLVGMSDPGLVIWPTHRVLGGMSNYSWKLLLGAGLATTMVPGGLAALERALISTPNNASTEPRIGLYDFATGEACLAMPDGPDPLERMFPEKPLAWRMLDVAFAQHAVVEAICEKHMNGGKPVKWAFPHTIPEVEAIGRGHETGAGGRFDGGKAQLAIIVRPTPLSAVRDISRAGGGGELMPQKSTFFYPKLATGLFINPLTDAPPRRM